MTSIKEDAEVDIGGLIAAIQQLEATSSPEIVASIFFEHHDGPNAVTNFSSQYPDIRADIETLYEIFGFDGLYEQLYSD